MGRAASQQTAYISDSDITELQRLVGWEPEPRQPPRRNLPDGLSLDEIAMALGLSRSAVGLILGAALKKLRVRFPEARQWLET